MTGASGLQPPPRRLLPGDRRVDALRDMAQALFVNGEQHLLLGGEVIVDGAREHPNLARDVAHRGDMVAALAEQPGGNVEQLLAAVVLSRSAARGICGGRNAPLYRTTALPLAP